MIAVREARWLGPITALFFVSATVSVASAVTLQERIDAAPVGAIIDLQPGQYDGPIIIDRPLILRGTGRPAIGSGGTGTVISITAPNVTVEGLRIHGSGSSLDEENSGISVEAPAAHIIDNVIEDVLFGIYLKEASGSEIRANTIFGKELSIARRGDAIRIWYSDDVTVEGNVVSGARDVVLWYSSALRIEGNTIRDGRYGLHFMYCDDAHIESNQLLGNSVGAFLMYSQRLRLVSNTIAQNHGPSGYGIGLKDMDDAVLRSNLLIGNRVGVYLDNSPREIESTSLLEGNLFAGNDIGISLLPNVRRGSFRSNSFRENAQQVAIAGSGSDPDANLWQGNYWSDYSGYDADSDGIGDIPYRSDRIFDDLTDRYTVLRLFTGSPVLQALSFAGRAFPLVKPKPRLVDEQPMMDPVGVEPAASALASGRDRLGPIGGGMLLGALALLLAPRWRIRAGSTGDRIAEGSPLIEVSNLTKSFGALEVLRAVSFEVEKGEAVALWGDNGAGKTTAMRAMLGLIPFGGRVRIGGHDPIESGKAARRLVGFVPQASAFPAELSVEESLDFFSRIRGLSSDRYHHVSKRLGLESEWTKKVDELSGGWKQRLALAIALLDDPPILFLDEPTANLDSDSRRELLELLVELKSEGRTLVFSSHRPDEVLQLADRVLHLDAGTLIRDVEPGTLLGEVELIITFASDEHAATTSERLIATSYPVRREGTRLSIRAHKSDKASVILEVVSSGFEILDIEFSAPGVTHV